MLVIEGEVGDVHLARALQLHGHGPQHCAVKVEEDIDALHEPRRPVISTGIELIEVNMKIAHTPPCSVLVLFIIFWFFKFI